MLEFYIGMTVVWALFSALIWAFSYTSNESKWSARMFILAPVWPLVALVVVAMTLGAIALDAFGKD